MRLTFLGIEMNTLSMTLSLPPSKLECLRREICHCESMKCCSKRELLSIIGQLQHACCVIRPGRSFLWHMIELSRCVRELHYRVHLNAGFQFDLQWWGCFLPIWNGSCLIASIVRGVSRTVLTSDASGSWDNGWKGLTVTCRSDNAAVVAIVNSGRSKMDRAMHLTRCLSFFLAKWGVSLLCRHPWRSEWCC